MNKRALLAAVALLPALTVGTALADSSFTSTSVSVTSDGDSSRVVTVTQEDGGLPQVTVSGTALLQPLGFFGSSPQASFSAPTQTAVMGFEEHHMQAQPLSIASPTAIAVPPSSMGMPMSFPFGSTSLAEEIVWEVFAQMNMVGMGGPY